MNKEIIQTAIRNGTLRKYDLTQARVRDKVFGWEPGEVLAVYGKNVVIGWDLGDGKVVCVYPAHHAHEIYLAPLCWVEDKPVYKGDVLYSPNGTVKVRTIDRVEKFQAYDDDDKAITRLRVYGDDGFWDSPEKLTWIDPSSYEVEGKVLKVGDTLFSKGGDKVTITALERGFIITTPGQVMGGTQWTADYLSWTDPTILFKVDGKPVRRGDVLYGKWPGSLPRGYEVIGKNSAGYPLWRNGILTYDLKDLTWIKPKSATLDIQEVLLDGIPLEAGQTIYYIGSNHNSPRTRIVQEFNLSQVRTLCEKGEDQGYNYLQFFSRKCPKVKYEKKELKPIEQVFMGEKFFYVDFSSDDGARDLRVQYFIPPWVDNLIRRGMCFSTREGAIRKFQKLLSASK